MSADVQEMQHKTVEQLRDEHVQRCAFEAAAQRIEQLAGNDIYAKAWRKAAKTVRAMKP